jgi:hypothetical protein
MRRLLTSSVVGLAALTVLAEAPPSLAGGGPQAAPSVGGRMARTARTAPGSPLPAGRAGRGTPPAAGETAGMAAPVPDRPVIRSVRVRPRTPVAGPKGTVKLVVEVVARGAAGRDGVTLRVEPGRRRHAPASSRRGGRSRTRGRPAATAPHTIAGAAPARRVPRWEIWRFNPPVGLTRWYPSGRWQVIATARNARGARATASSSFLFKKAAAFGGVRVTRVRKHPRAVRVSGTLTRVDPSGRFDYWSFPRQRVTVQFRKHGGKAWKSVAKARTGRGGRFVRRVKRARGVWRVVFPGTRHYAPIHTSLRHVARS